MIEQIELKFGSTAGGQNLIFEPSAITVFVGPNNAGKSKLISEIAHKCLIGQPTSRDLLLKEINFSNVHETVLEEEIKNVQAGFDPDLTLPVDLIQVEYQGSKHQVSKNQLRQSMLFPNNIGNRHFFAQYYLSQKTLMLNGRNRIDLANDQPGGDLISKPKTSFQKIFKNDNLRRKFRETVFRSLGVFPIIDPTFLGQLRLRLSSVAPVSDDFERGLSDASIKFNALAQHVAEASDGAKAFTGILAEIFAGDPKILLMDEPEAFLHPALAFNLGREIATSIAKTDKKIFVSTHSPQFLMGCIQSGVSISIVRLTYRNGSATARLLPGSAIVQLMRNPLLRSVGVISALFYQSVIVTEADADRAFYQEINERLLRTGRGITNGIFLNAQSKQTVPTIIKPIRDLGIPAAAIYDIDFLKDGGNVATRFMQAAGIPPIAQQGLSTTRAKLADALLTANSAYKTTGGIQVLANETQRAANDYLDLLADYGAFIVRRGELESWLKHLNIPGHGPKWLTAIFETMGEDPEVQNYLQPTQDDVWSFLDSVAKWLSDPLRKGIPE